MPPGGRIGSEAGQHAYEQRQGAEGGADCLSWGGQIASGERGCPIYSENLLAIHACFRESATVLVTPN